VIAAWGFVSAWEAGMDGAATVPAVVACGIPVTLPGATLPNSEPAAVPGMAAPPRKPFWPVAVDVLPGI